MRSKVWSALLAGAGLAACAVQGPVEPVMRVVEPAPPLASGGGGAAPPDQPGEGFAGLPGWADDDHAAALLAFQAGCGASRDPPLADVCRRARAAGRMGEQAARGFLEANFRPHAAPETGLLTAYFTPLYEARDRPSGAFTAPVRPRPGDLPGGARTAPGDYPDRAAIEARPAGDALAWMRPEDLFFMQVQGSGVLIFPGGARSRAVFDGTNGARFVGIAAPLRQQGLIADGATSGEAIRAWLAANRGAPADAIMRANPRYVFFSLRGDDGGEPIGAAGLPLIPGRAVAVDPSRHAMGEMLWIDAASPALAGAVPFLRRLAVALDTGGAIKGEARADLYMGRGPAAGLEAGRVRHVLRLYRLTPVGRPGA